ncbi:hypothetical protein GCM10027436_55760 [Actinophytocola sediminis]
MSSGGRECEVVDFGDAECERTSRWLGAWKEREASRKIGGLFRGCLEVNPVKGCVHSARSRGSKTTALAVWASRLWVVWESPSRFQWKITW